MDLILLLIPLLAYIFKIFCINSSENFPMGLPTSSTNYVVWALLDFSECMYIHGFAINFPAYICKDSRNKFPKRICTGAPDIFPYVMYFQKEFIVLMFIPIFEHSVINFPLEISLANLDGSFQGLSYNPFSI